MGIAALCVAPAVTLAVAPKSPEAVPLTAVLPTADHLDPPMLPPPAAAIHDIAPHPATPPAPVAPPSPPPPVPHAITRAVVRAPSLPAPAHDHASIRGIITDAALAHGVDPSWMIAIATCESGLNPRAVEPHGHYGLFQFLPSTYSGNGGHDLWNPVEQAAITATMLSHGQAWQWACAHR